MSLTGVDPFPKAGPTWQRSSWPARERMPIGGGPVLGCDRPACRDPGDSELTVDAAL